MNAKTWIRRKVWKSLEENKASLFPKPIEGRIPNFIGAEKAAEKIFSTSYWRKAEVVKVNPDSPQKHVRLKALMEGKIVLMPTPRIKEGFLLLDSTDIPREMFGKASTIRGAFRFGRKIGLNELLNLRKIDLIVEGSVAVSAVDGSRLGKGEGYGELEYAILRELCLIEEDIPIMTTVHDLQVFNEPLPQDPWDVSVDVIATPTRLIRVKQRLKRPTGVIWKLLPQRKLDEIPLLKALLRLKKN